MPGDTQAAGLLTPKQLRQITEETAISDASKAAMEAKKAEEQKKAERKAFMERELRPDAMDYLMRAARHLAERRQHEFLVLRFPAELLSDSGRRVNNGEQDWPDSLQGFAKRAYDYYQQYLQPAGYLLRAQVLDYPHGNLGDVGIFLCW